MARPQDNNLEKRLGTSKTVNKGINWNEWQYKSIRAQMAKEKAEYDAQVKAGFEPEYMYPTDFSKMVKKAWITYLCSQSPELLKSVNESNKLVKQTADSQEFLRDVVLALHSEMQTIIKQNNEIAEQNREIRVMQDYIIQAMLEKGEK